jgi:hypothetical protein
VPSPDWFWLCTVAVCATPFKAGLVTNVTNKTLLYQAALKLADHKRQSGRTSGLRLLAEVPLEDFHLVAEKVQHIIDDKDPTYHSYHNQGRGGPPLTSWWLSTSKKDSITCRIPLTSIPENTRSS